ncbi:hypothetical protein SEA_GIRLPOWER_52 [Streptomyces phage GirlPower]|nr:hypothetical protein SEA_GIRLPOWER_52 [Streptomyces phage GirlPower]
MFTKLLWAALGAAAGYYVAKTQLHDYYVEKLRKETEDAQYFFKEKYEEKLRRTLQEKQEAFWDGDDAAIIKGDPWEGEGETPSEDLPASILSEEAAEALTNYQGISSAPSVLAQEMVKAQMGEAVEEAEKIVEEAEEAEQLDAATNPNAPGPRLINFTMFDANEDDYDQATVTYFADGVVADENDEKMSKEVVNKHIGDYNLEQLNDRRKTIYVRNDRYRMDFEIVWDSNTYADVKG